MIFLETQFASNKIDSRRRIRHALIRWKTGIFSISFPIFSAVPVSARDVVAFPATTKIMIGHRLGHLNFTLYRKQRRPPNHGVNVNDARIRKPFRRTRKLNDNDILHRRCAEILIRLENILFFLLSLPFFVIHLFLSSFQLRNFASFFLPPPPPPSPPPPFFPYFRLSSAFVWSVRFLFCKNPR